jgi:hypothetical protein
MANCEMIANKKYSGAAGYGCMNKEKKHGISRS